MKVLAAISSPGQDEVIEKVLRARGEWPSGPALRAGLRARLSEPTSLRLVPGSSELFAPPYSVGSQPPWKQPRPARGPPPREHSTCPLREEEQLEGTEMIDPQRDVDEYCVDPPSPEDF
jgi:hypothetical protein